MVQQNRNYNRSRQQKYAVEGNTVRKFSAVPAREREIQRQHMEHAVRRNREKSRFMNAGYTLFLIGVSILASLLCYKYITLQSDMINSTKNITKLETKLADLKLQNDEEYNRINSSIDLEQIKKIAIEELGMVYANKEQVILYEDHEIDYVRQYADIPKINSKEK